MSQRTQRVDELLRQEIGQMLEREIADPRIGFATVTEVESTADLRHARVWVSVIGGAAERDHTIAGLEHAMVYVRRELGARLRIRRIPDLHVRLDDSIERGTRVLRLIESIESGQEVEPTPPGESLPTPSTPNRGAEEGEQPAVAPSDSDGFGAAAAEFAAAREERQAARRAAAAGGKGGGRQSAGRQSPTRQSPGRRGGRNTRSGR